MTKAPSCGYPVAAISDQRDFLNPAEYLRSTFITIRGEPLYDCAISFTQNISWVLEGIDSYTYNSTGFVSLSENPSSSFSALGLVKNTLEYALYRATLTIAMAYTDPDTGIRITRTASQATYIRVVVTGISVYAFGQVNFLIGSSASLDFNAVLRTEDPDMYANISALNFTFVCYIFNSTSQSVMSSDLTDLYSLQQNNDSEILNGRNLFNKKPLNLMHSNKKKKLLKN
jgi:hypothetical protein